MAWAGLLVALTTPPERWSEHKGEVVACPGPLSPGGHLRQPCAQGHHPSHLGKYSSASRQHVFARPCPSTFPSVCAESWGPPGPPEPSEVTPVPPQGLPEPPQTWRQHKGEPSVQRRGAKGESRCAGSECEPLQLLGDVQHSQKMAHTPNLPVGHTLST